MRELAVSVQQKKYRAEQDTNDGIANYSTAIVAQGKEKPFRPGRLAGKTKGGTDAATHDKAVHAASQANGKSNRKRNF